jgi:hypothetical protein
MFSRITVTFSRIGLRIQKDLCRKAIQSRYVTVTEMGGYGGVI